MAVLLPNFQGTMRGSDRVYPLTLAYLEPKIFVEMLSSDTAVLQRLPTKKWAKSSFFLINVAKSIGNPE